MEFLDLFLVALMPVLKVLLVTVIELFLATNRVDLLGAGARNNLNNLVFNVFSPALIASKLAYAITLKSLVKLWFMPVNILLTFIIGAMLGWVLVKITRTPQHLQGLIISCCSAGNLGNLLLIILPALCEEDSSIFGDSTTCSAYAEAYASLSMAVLAIYIWTFEFFIMRASENDETEDINANESTVIITSSEATSEIFPESATEPLLSSDGLPNTQNYSNQVESPHARIEENIKEPVVEQIKQRIHKFAAKINLKRILAPSTIAAILGFIIGIVSPIRKMMIGNTAPLHVIYSSADLIGAAAIPSITLIVGANLLKGLKGSGPGLSTILGIIVVRFIALPPIGIMVVKAGQHFGIVESDALYQFALMLQFAVPPAMNIGTIAQMLKTAAKSECSVIMLWTYAVASLFLTFWSILFMWIVS